MRAAPLLPVHYQGTIPAAGHAASTHTVVVTYSDGDRRLLEHRVHHSPTGFSWGYAGSGPADLARSILWEHLGSEPHPPCYQDFKASFVARLPQDRGWRLSSAELEAWLLRWEQTPGRYRTVAAYEASFDSAVGE